MGMMDLLHAPLPRRGRIGGLLAALLAAQACLACFATKLHLAGGASRWGTASDEAAPEPVRIAVRSPGHFIEGFEHTFDDCLWRGKRFTCEYTNTTDPAIHEAADALLYHAPNVCAFAPGQERPMRRRKGQPLVVYSMESTGYYPCLDAPSFMSLFDIEMTYRLSSQVPLSYLRVDQLAAFAAPQGGSPGLGFAERAAAAVFVQSNCKVPSGRTEIISNMMSFGDVAIHSYGKCLNSRNRSLAEGESKMDVFRRYRFCIAMENTVAHDYVTEKLWDAFAAGCVPVYYGAPNIAKFLPAANAIVDYRALGSPAALRLELQRLNGDARAWEAKVAWHAKPLSALAPGFRRLARLVSSSHAQCQLCARLVDRRFNDTRAEDAHRRAWGLPDGPAAGVMNVTEMAVASENLNALVGQMQVALLDVMVQREEGLKRGKERMAAALDDMVAEGKAEYTHPVGQAAAREPKPRPAHVRMAAAGHGEEGAPLGQAAAGSDAVVDGEAERVTPVGQVAAHDSRAAAGHAEHVIPLGQAAAGSDAVVDGEAGRVAPVGQVAAVDNTVWAGPGGLRAGADAA